MNRKLECVLYLYQTSLKKGCFASIEAKSRFNLDSLSFHRYVGDLKKYFKRYVPGISLKYSRHKDLYVAYYKDIPLEDAIREGLFTRDNF